MLIKTSDLDFGSVITHSLSASLLFAHHHSFWGLQRWPSPEEKESITAATEIVGYATEIALSAQNALH